MKSIVIIFGVLFGIALAKTTPVDPRARNEPTADSREYTKYVGDWKTAQVFKPSDLTG
jgi:hypothetical protein